jgi:signal transduction histidine kinase
MSTQDDGEMKFMARLGHELRTLINGIRGHVDNLLDGVHGDVSPDQRPSLVRMRRNADDLLVIANRALDGFANGQRVEALNFSDVRLSEVIADVESLSVGPANTKGIAFDASSCISGRCHDVARADRTALLQILTNLVNNAIKFTAPGGRVTVDCVSNVDAQMVEVRVTDTGPGIPADRLSSVFEEFVRLAEAPGGAEQGVGLGLAISRGLARAMGGDLRAVSTVGVGSTFTLVVPRV